MHLLADVLPVLAELLFEHLADGSGIDANRLQGIVLEYALDFTESSEDVFYREKVLVATLRFINRAVDDVLPRLGELICHCSKIVHFLLHFL